MVEVSCPHCGVNLKAPEDRIGKKARCKKCQQPFRVPGPIPMAEPVGDEPQALSVVAMPTPRLPPDEGEDDRTELMTVDQMPPLPPLPPPKAKPAPVSAATPAPAVKPAPAPPAARPASGTAKAAPPKSTASVPGAKAAEPLPIGDEAEPLADIPSDAPPKSKPRAKAKPAAESVPDPESEPALTDNAFAFGLTDEPSEAPKPKKKRDEEEKEKPEPKKAPANGKTKAAPADGALAFGFTDEPSPPETAKPKKKRDEDDKPAELGNKKAVKKTRDLDEPEDDENKPRYRRPEEKGSGMAKMMLITAFVGFFAVGLGIAAFVVYAKKNKPPPEVKKEEKKEEPIPDPPVTPPVVVPPVTPKDKVDPKPKDTVDPKKDKEPDPVPTRPGFELAIKSKPFDIGKEKDAAKLERADKPGEPRFVLETAFASVLRAFPPFDPKSADTYAVVREGAKLSLDAYSPSSGKRISRLEFAADLTRPICDLYASVTDSQFLAVSDGKITVWNLADQKKLFDAVDPYAGKPDHEKNGIAAAFFSVQPSQIVVVSTAGAVHLYSLPAKASVAEFAPPHGAKGKVVLDESVARAEGGGSIVLAVGGVLYQIQSSGNLARLRTHDLGGDAKPLAVAASGTPGRLLFAFETDAKGKKDRGLLYLPLGAGAKPVISLWPTVAGTPKSAFWVGDTSAGVATENGVVWFDEEMNKFGPLVVTRPVAAGLYLGAGNQFLYVVPHPSKPAQSVLVTLAVPFGDAFDFRREAATRLRVVRIDSNGLAK